MNFNSETYEPYAYCEPNREVHQRINQVHSQAGNPAVLDWPDIDQSADEMDALTFARFSTFDEHPEARNLARANLRAHRLYVESNELVGETLIGDHGGMQWDAHDPRTQNRLYAIFAFDPRVLYPLCKQWTHEDAAKKYLTRYTTCDVDVVSNCERTYAHTILDPKSGEFVHLFKCCKPCRAWFDLTPDQREALRTRTFFDDDWDRR